MDDRPSLAFLSFVPVDARNQGISSHCVAPDPSLGGNPAVTIEADRPVVIAIPPKGSPLALAVRNAVVNSMAAHRS